jgi:hypothetical protein
MLIDFSLQGMAACGVRDCPGLVQEVRFRLQGRWPEPSLLRAGRLGAPVAREEMLEVFPR